MNENNHSCFRFGVSHICPKCKSDKLIKSGKTVTGKQHIVVKSAVNDLLQNILTKRIKLQHVFYNHP